MIDPVEMTNGYSVLPHLDSEIVSSIDEKDVEDFPGEEYPVGRILDSPSQISPERNEFSVPITQTRTLNLKPNRTYDVINFSSQFSEKPDEGEENLGDERGKSDIQGHSVAITNNVVKSNVVANTTLDNTILEVERHNILEARDQIQRNKLQQRAQAFPVEEDSDAEDNFGEQSMEGLMTPPNERDDNDNGSDLDSFIERDDHGRSSQAYDDITVDKTFNDDGSEASDLD